MRSFVDGIANILGLVTPYWKYARVYLLGRLTLSVVVTPAIALIQVRLVQSVIDAIEAGSAMWETIAVAAVLVGITLGLMALNWTFLLLYDRWKAEEMRIRINRGIYEQSIVTDYKYFDNPEFYNSFTLAAGELAAKSESALQLLADILGSISIIAAMTAYLSTLGPWIILISAAGQVICLIAQRIIQKLGIKKTTEALEHDRKINYIHRIVYQKQYAADIKSTDLPQKLLSMFDRSGERKVGVYKTYAKRNTWANMLQFAAWHLCQFAQMAYLIICVFVRGLGLGAIAGMFAAADRLNQNLNQFVAISSRAMEVSLYAEKIKAFYGYGSEIEPQTCGAQPPGGAFALELRDLSFSYPNSGFALEALSLSIAPGEKIAIVGENGAGKTTLAKLLLRLYDADGGEILYNGRPARDYDVHKLRRRVGVAFQDPQLYALTVRDNLELYNKADDGTLREVLRMVGLNIALDSVLTREFDEKGAMLSGGQAQRLALARLMHGEFGLLLLDEPSSALDPLAEYDLVRLIFDRPRTTVIMVAHRLSTIRGADRIYLIDSGKIAESGTHDELVASGGKYARMFAMQAENYA